MPSERVTSLPVHGHDAQDVNLLVNMHNFTREKLMNYIHMGGVQKGKIILSKGDKVNFLFIVKEGKIH